MKTPADLATRLGELHRRTAETPLFNPVFQLSLDLSRELEGGSLKLAEIEALVSALECDGLNARAEHLQRLIGPVDGETSALVQGEAEDFAAFCALWERPQLHAVFTAHPTFLLTEGESAAVASAASATAPVDETPKAAPSARPAVTLEDEHRAAMAAITRAVQRVM